MSSATLVSHDVAPSLALMCGPSLEQGCAEKYLPPMEEKEGRPIVVEDNYGARWCFRYRYPLRLPSWWQGWRQLQLEAGLFSAQARCGPPCTLFRT
jgi:hypothetical protein